MNAKITLYMLTLLMTAFMLRFSASNNLNQAGLHADQVLEQTMFAKNESGFEWVIGLQLKRIDTHFKGKIVKVIYEIVVKEKDVEIDRTTPFSLDMGDYRLEDANGNFNASQLYKLKYIAPRYYEHLDFKLAFREIYFDTGEIAKFDKDGKYLTR